MLTMVQNVPLTNLLTQQINSQALKGQFSSLITPVQEAYCLSYERHNQLIISSSMVKPSEWRTSPFHRWETSTAMDITLTTLQVVCITSCHLSEVAYGERALLFWTFNPYGMSDMFWQQLLHHQPFSIATAW